jgi:hypothetical protein
LKSLAKQFRRHLRRIIAVSLLGALYMLARLPEIPDSGRQSLAARFRFDRVPLPVVFGSEVRSVRPVHPSLRHIAAWISAVGAAVALNDLDGDGLPNDLCYVDVRTDQVIVAPVPGTGDRYHAFALDAGPLFSRATMAPMGCLPGDMNEDGHMDLLVYYWGRTPIAFLHQRAGMYSAGYRPVDIFPGGARWYTNAATFADLDGDGHPDLIIGNYFEDGARILDASAGGSEHMQHSMSRAFNGGGDRLMLWQSASPDSVTFRDVPSALPNEVALGWTLAAGAADLDGDLLPEVYFANDFGPDRLLHNRSTPGHLRFELLDGRRTFAVPASKVMGHDSFKGMGVDFGDLNGDGWPDLFVSNIAAPYALEESHFAWVSTGRVEQMRDGIAPYVDRSEDLGLSRSGWSWDARLADFDNDGIPEALQAVGFVRGTVNRWPELHEIAMGNDELLSKPSVWHHFTPGDDLSGHMHNPFYVRASDGRYYDVAHEMGMDESHVSRGIAIADVDGDGRLDYAVANQWEDSWFYRNSSPYAGAFLGLRIRRGRVPVIGATATVYLPDGRRVVAQSDGGSGHSGKRSPDIHFGLGNVSPDQGLRVDIRWRDASGVHAREYRLAPGWKTIDIQGPI